MTVKEAFKNPTRCFTPEDRELFDEGNLVNYEGDVWLITDENSAVRVWDKNCKRHVGGFGVEESLDDWDKEDVTQFKGTLTFSI